MVLFSFLRNFKPFVPIMLKVFECWTDAGTFRWNDFHSVVSFKEKYHCIMLMFDQIFRAALVLSEQPFYCCHDNVMKSE